MADCNPKPAQHPCRSAGVGPSCFNPVTIPTDTNTGPGALGGKGNPGDDTTVVSSLPPNVEGTILSPCCDDCEYPDDTGGDGGTGDGTDDGGPGDDGGDEPVDPQNPEDEPGFTVDPGKTVPDGNDAGDKAKKECIERKRKRIDKEIQACLCECYGGSFQGKDGGKQASSRPGQSAWCWGYCVDRIESDFHECFCLEVICGGDGGDDPKDKPVDPTKPTDPKDPPPDPRYETVEFGPVIKNISFPGSTYEEIIPLVYNRGVLGGNVIWASPERVVTKCIGEYRTEEGGGLVVISNRVRQTYIDFALALSEGELAGVARIWIGEQLIYNNTLETDSNGFVTGSDDGSVVTTVENISMFKKDEKNLDKFDRTTMELRVYTGSEDQPIDPSIFADLGQKAPAFRGLAYIVFKNFELTGNDGSIPALKVEVVRNAVNVRPKQISALVDSSLKQVKPDLLWFDEADRRFYVGAASNNSSVREGIRSISYDALSEVSQFAGGLTPNAPNEDFDHRTFMMSPRGNFVVQTGAAGGTRPVVVVSPREAYGRQTYGAHTGNVEHTSTSIADISRAGGTPSGYVRIRLSDGGYYDTLFLVDDNDVAYLIERDFGTYTRFNPGQTMNFSPSAVVAFASMERNFVASTDQDTVAHKSNEFYLLTTPGTLSAITLYRGVAYSSEEDKQYYSVFRALEPFVLGAQNWGGHTAGEVMYVMTDAKYSCLFIMLRFASGAGALVKWNIITQAVEWSVDLPSAPPYSSTGSRTTSEGTKFYHFIGADNNVYSVNKRTGLVARYANLTTTYGLPLIGGAQFYDSLAQSITYITNTHQLARVFIGRIFTGTTRLADVVFDIMQRSGLEAHEYDVEALFDIPVDGYVIATNVTMRAALAQLGVIYDFIPRQRDHQLVFTPEGVDTGLALDNVNLEHKDGLTITRVTAVEADAFHSARVTYYDIGASMAQNTQVITSAIQPPRGQENTGSITISYPFASSAAFAAGLAERLLYNAAANSQTGKLLAGPSMLGLEPGDYVTVYIEGVLPQTYLVKSSTVGADRTNQLDLLRRDGDTLAVALQPQPPLTTNDGDVSALIPLSGARPLGIPTSIVTVADGREGYDRVSGLYGGIIHTGTADYVPRKLFARLPTGAVASKGTPTRALDTGIALTTLPVSDSLATDNDTEFVVRFARPGAFEVFVDGADHDAFFAVENNNLLYVGGELIQFRDYSIDPDNVTYRFRKLLRGRFSTTYYMGSHQGAEFVCAYSPASWVLIEGSVDNQTADQYAVAVQVGLPTAAKYIEDIQRVDHDFVKFYSPANLRRSIQGNGDFLLSVNLSNRVEDITTDLNDSPTPEAVFSQITRFYILSGTYDEQAFIAALTNDPGGYIRSRSTFGASFTYNVSSQVADGFNAATDTLHVVAFFITEGDNLAAFPRGHPNYRAIQPEYRT